MRILVAGGCGYVGSVLVPKLLALGHSVVVYDTLWFGNYLKPHRDLMVIKQDIREPLPEPSQRIDAIINLAAIADDHTSELDHALTWSVGAQGTLALCEYAQAQGVRRFIHASSGSIYGATDEPAFVGMPLRPTSYYNQVKHVAERILLSYCNSFEVLIVRPGAVCGYSSRLRLETTVNNLTAKALATGKITVYGGSQLRPFVHIEDLCDFYVELLTARVSLPLWVNASTENLSVAQVALMVQKATGAEIVTEPTTDTRSYHMESTPFLRAFKPQCTIEHAIGHLVAGWKSGFWRDEDKHYNLRVMRSWAKSSPQ